MIEQDLLALCERDASSLDGLERDIWRRENRARAARRTIRQMTAWQAAVMLVAVLSSAGFGASRALASHRDNALFTRADLAPARLLLGEKE